MTDNNQAENELERFILDQVDSVPHLEALLLVWNSRPKAWSVEEMAKALFLVSSAAKRILQDLALRGLISGDSGSPDVYRYESGRNDYLVGLLDVMYRKELVRLSRMIHSKPSASVREFAQAFRLRKENE